MGRVTIICPTTGRPVPTGLLMDSKEFEHAALEHNVLRCPACGRIHTWRKEDARIEDDPQA